MYNLCIGYGSASYPLILPQKKGREIEFQF